MCGHLSVHLDTLALFVEDSEPIYGSSEYPPGGLGPGLPHKYPEAWFSAFLANLVKSRAS